MKHQLVLFLAMLVAVAGWLAWHVFFELGHKKVPIAQREVHGEEPIVLLRGTEEPAPPEPTEKATLAQSESNPDSSDAPDKSRFVEVVFPDGERIQITLRPKKRSQGFIIENVAEVYPWLKAEAEDGNLDAAYELSQQLFRCNNFAPRNQSSLDKAVDQIYQTHTVPYPMESESWPITNGDTASAVWTVQSHYEKCKGLTSDQLGEADHWERVAVEGGHLEGVQDYAGRHWGERKSLEFLEAAWLDGFSPVLWQIAVYYRSFNPKIYGIVPQDRVTAYAYSFLSWKLFELRWSRKDIDMESLRNGQEERLESHSLRLREHEVRTAMQLAKTILRNNENCCYE